MYALTRLAALGTLSSSIAGEGPKGENDKRKYGPSPEDREREGPMAERPWEGEAGRSRYG